MADGTRFAGKVAVVTGGASGIGYAAAERLLREGARLAVWDRNASALAELAAKLGGQVHTEAFDTVDHAAVARAADATAAALGGIDILVASAGIAGPNYTSWEFPIEEWTRVIDVNINGLYYCNRYVVPHMLKRGYGRIVNVASIAGKEGNPNASPYSASKAAVIGFTKSLGKELAKTEIRVNCITPAAVRTPIFDQITQQHIDYMLSRIPIGRLGRVEEIAAMICWLASEEVSFTTGGVFDCSGGRATY
jgi:NAD(P)-dependent dehydrogenase (short-subunit alcohol dehydrogenase family)